MAQGESLVYACCSFGIGRWCWILWASDSEARAAARPLAEGFEKTAAAAEQKAIEAAGSQATRLPGKWASSYKRGGAFARVEAGKQDKPKSRLSRRADISVNGKGRTRLTFLYAAFEDDRAGSRGEVVIVKHQVVRQTAGKFYVDREPFAEEEKDRQDASKKRLLAVGREVLRRDGRFPHGGSYLYASEEIGLQSVYADLTARHAWCAALDIRFPCSTESIRSAYRRLALEKHPDVGGDQVEFQAVERAYREGLAYFSDRETGSGTDLATVIS